MLQLVGMELLLKTGTRDLVMLARMRSQSWLVWLKAWILLTNRTDMIMSNAKRVSLDNNTDYHLKGLNIEATNRLNLYTRISAGNFKSNRWVVDGILFRSLMIVRGCAEFISYQTKKPRQLRLFLKLIMLGRRIKRDVRSRLSERTVGANIIRRWKRC